MSKYSALVCAVMAFALASGLSLAQAVRSPIIVTVSPDTTTVASSQLVQLTALVKNTPSSAVRWSVSAGSISSTGLYHAPRVNSDTVITVKATSLVDSSKASVASILVTAPKPKAATAATMKLAGTTINESFFGAGFHGWGVWPPTDGQKQVATLGGIRLWDDNVKWAQIETAKGVYDWLRLDTWISKAQAQHVDVLYTIGSTPQWAGTSPKSSPCGAQGRYSCLPPKDLNADGTGADAYFSDFVTALVTRYKGQIAYYELWNEADCTCFFSGTTAQIVRMGKDAAAIIRSIDPNAKILSPSAHGPTMATWFDNYVAAGGAANFDIVNAHLRGKGSTNASPEAFLTMYNDVTAELSKRNLTQLPIWDDEYGIKPGQMTDPDQLAGFVARSLALRAGVGVQRQYIYTWDAGSLGLQGNESGTAFDVVAGWLLNHSISPCVASGTVYTCNLDSGQIVWDTAQSCHNRSCTTSKYTYPTEYHYQIDLTGTKSQLGGSTVAIGYKPIFLTAN